MASGVELNNAHSIEAASSFNNVCCGAEFLQKLTTEEFAKIILLSPVGEEFAFATRAIDMKKQPSPWYTLVIYKLFEEYAVFIDRCNFDGSDIFNFKLQYFNDKVDYEIDDQDELCVNETINGLNRFNALYGTEPCIWYFSDQTSR